VSQPANILLLWFIAVLMVFTIALIQDALQHGRRFSLRHLIFFATLIAFILGLFAMIWRSG
jgi:hypothetical protein